MKISTLKLTNFRSHASTEFHLSRVNIFRGPNGAGKSSIQMALEYLLTGRCDVTDQGGRGAQNLISSGQSQLTVEAELERAKLIRTRNQASGNLVIVDGQSRTGKMADAWIETKLAPVPVLSSVLNAHRFLEMNEKEQKALLAGALASDPVAVDAEMVALFSKSIAKLHADTVSSAGEVDALHKTCFDIRSGVNRELKSIGELSEPEKPAGMPSYEAVLEKIAEIQKERDKAVERRAKKLSEFTVLKAKIEAAKATVEQMGSWALDDAELTRIDKALKNRTKVAKLDKEISDLSSRLTQLKLKLSQLKELQNPGVCPTCGAKREAVESLEIVPTTVELKQVEEELETKQAERRKLPDNFEELKQKLDRHKLAAVKVVEAEALLRETIEPDSPDTSAEDEEIDELDSRMAKGRVIEGQIVEFESKLKAYQKQKDRSDALREKAAALDRLVEYFGDKGPLKAALVGGKLPDFVQKVNAVLNRFGFECRVELDPYRMQVRGTPDWLDVSQLSESEAYRFGIAFQIALAEVTGVRLVVIDRADMLVPSARRELTQALLASNLDQAFVLATGEPGPTPQIPDVAFFELTKSEDGFITQVQAEPEEAHADR